MQKEFKGFKASCRYLVKDESKFWDTSFEIIVLTVLKISEKAIKIKYENGTTKWYLKESFNFSMIENLSILNQKLQQKSKLQWETNPPSNQMSWNSAMKYAKSLGNGWRLPTIEELYEASLNSIEGFNDDCYWSSSTSGINNDSALYIDFWLTNIYNDAKEFSYYVRCVKEVETLKGDLQNSSQEILDDDDWKDRYDATLRLE